MNIRLKLILTLIDCFIITEISHEFLILKTDVTDVTLINKYL